MTLDAAMREIVRQVVREELRPASVDTVPDFSLAVTVADAATRCGVSASTMRGWIRAGLVPTIRMTEDGHQLVRVATLDQILRSHEQGGIAWQPDGINTPAPLKTRGRQLKRAPE